MIEPTITTPAAPVTPPASFNVQVTAEDLAALVAAVETSNVVKLPEGKTLADITNLNIRVFSQPRDGKVAGISGQMKA
jgi:hypothetical protein